MSSVKDSYYGAKGSSFPVTTAYAFAQTFTASQTYTASKIRLVMAQVPTITAVVNFDIRATSTVGLPTGTALMVGNVLASTLNQYTAGLWNEITFGTGGQLSSGLVYGICAVITAAGGGGSVRIFRTAVGGYSGGAIASSGDMGLTWAISTTVGISDADFEVWGVASAVADSVVNRKLCAVGNNRFYYEETTGVLTELVAARDVVDQSFGIAMFEGYGKAFIANDVNLKVCDFINTLISTDASGLGAGITVAPNHNTILTGGTSSAEMVVDYINAVSSQAVIYGRMLTVHQFWAGETITGTNDSGNAVSFTNGSAAFTTAPHWYNWTPYGNNTTYGAMPDQASLGCLYRGRPTLAGDKRYPNQWYMARQGDPWDWNYVANDAQSPVAGHNADAGELGDIITALIPRKDDYLIFGCVHSIWVLRGDPASGGSLDEVSLATGIFGANSWCFDAEDNLYFWGSNGIYLLPVSAGGIGIPQNLTSNIIPNIVAEISADPTVHRITMGYDRERHGIVIAVTNRSNGTNQNYWLDLRTKGFFPETYPAACGIFSMHFLESNSPSYRKLLLGCNDGYVRKFDDTVKDDDIGATDTAISSYVVLGPAVLASDPHKQARITDSTIIAAGGASSGAYSDTDGFNLSFYRGKEPETVLEDIEDGATAFYTVAVTGTGRKTRIRTKISGNALAVKIHTTASSQTWGFEKFIANFKEIGKVR